MAKKNKNAKNEAKQQQPKTRTRKVKENQPEAPAEQLAGNPVAEEQEPVVESPTDSHGGPVTTPVTAPVTTPIVVDVPDQSGNVTVVLNKRITEKGGLTSYARPGVRASIYLTKSMFKAGVLPETITVRVAAGVLAEPGEVKVKDSDPAKAAKLAEAAQKAAERAKKAQERAQKAEAKAKAVAAKAAPAAEPALT